jgi:moderate conductance mechanosensitive channel
MNRDLLLVLSIAAAFVIAALVVSIGRRILQRSLARLQIVSDANRQAVQARAKQVVRALRIVAFGIAALASVAVALSRLGLQVPEWRPREIARWSVLHGIHIVAIVAAAYIVIRAANLTIEHLEFKVAGDEPHGLTPELHRRAKTLGGVASNLVTVVVGLIAVMMLLRELSIDVLPLLTGAGIAGLAIGFGAQNLVRDTIAGFFMILEDQIRVGDAVRVNNVGGTVEELNLRTTVLRDVEGAVHIFPNGSITTLANLSKDFSYAIVDIAVGRGENLDRVVATLNDIGAALEQDPVVAPLLLGPLDVLGVESIGAAQMTIRARVKTVPLKQADVARALRRRIVSEFGARGIARAG